MFVEGGCFCGSIRYKLESNDYPSANCQCSLCRRTSGAAFVSWVRVPNDCFEYISGEPKKIDSSSHGARYFCQECGTHVACILQEDPKNTNITIFYKYHMYLCNRKKYSVGEEYKAFFRSFISNTYISTMVFFYAFRRAKKLSSRVIFS